MNNFLLIYYFMIIKTLDMVFGHYENTLIANSDIVCSEILWMHEWIWNALKVAICMQGYRGISDL